MPTPIESAHSSASQADLILRELDALGSQNADQTLQYQQALSRLTDVDFTQAISNLTLQQATLQAAQQSYLRVTGLSLFNFL